MEPYENFDKAGQAFITHVLPTLSRLVDQAGEQMARDLYGTPDAYDVEKCQQAVMYATTDFLENTTHDRSEFNMGGDTTTQPHHLRAPDFARAWFAIQLRTYAPRRALRADQQAAIDAAIDRDEAAPDFPPRADERQAE